MTGQDTASADEPPREAATSRSSLRRARIAVLVVALALIALEQGLYHLGGYGRVPATTADAALGYRTLPNQSVTGVDGIHIRINRDGYRDRDWSRSTDADDARPTRIALLGESVTYGLRAPVEATWGRRLEERVSGRHGVQVRTMNFAQPGYTFEQLARAWEAHAREFRPDALILAVNGHSARPMLVLPPADDFPLREALLKTATYDFLRRGVFDDTDFLQFEEDEPAGREEQRRSVRAIRAAMRLDPYAPEHDALWATMRAHCERVIEDCNELGVEVYVLCIPQLGDVLGEPRAWCGERWAAWAKDGLDCTVLDALPVFREAMAPILDELAAEGSSARGLWSRRPDPDLARRFAGSPHSLYLIHDPAHLSPAGHDRLADWLADELRFEKANPR